jgi:alpha-tubulin suppressor-like RCC1 family protein
MTEINKTALLTQIDSIISGLNLSTDQTTKLSLYYKTALNAGAIAPTVLAEIISRAESASSSDSIEELLLLALSGSIITNDRSNTVADLVALNTLTDISPGTVYFVLSENVPYVKKINGDWTLIDISLQPLALENTWAWGNNNNGRLGDNTTTTRSSPVSVVGGFTDWIQVSAGTEHSLGLRANGTAWAWGYNGGGRLGDNTYITKSSPVSVVGGFTDWIQVSAGFNHSLGVRANGTAWAWGSDNSFGMNYGGRLGINIGSGYYISPMSVVGGFTDWVQVSAGYNHSLGVRANGTAWAWGDNFYNTYASGQLGDNTLIPRSSPVPVVGDFADWVQVSAGNAHSLGVRANGTAWAWGKNSTVFLYGNFSGQLGDNTTTDKSSPVSVVGGFTDWIQVSAGGAHSLGLRANGTAWAWGDNSIGQLGDNTTTARSSPVSVVGGFTDWIQVSAGSDHSLGVRANGTAWAWGANTFGRLGNNTTTSSRSPVSVVGGFTDWIQVSAGGNHSLGVRGG